MSGKKRSHVLVGKEQPMPQSVHTYKSERPNHVFPMSSPFEGSQSMVAGKGISHRSFLGANGDIEHFMSISAPSGVCFDEQVICLQERYKDVQKVLKISPDTAVFRRIFLSDSINQAAKLYASGLFSDSSENPVAVSVVQQPPLPVSKIALLAYHVESRSPFRKRRLSSKHVLVEKSGTRHLWSTRLCCGSRAASAPEHVHTREIFDELMDVLKRQGGNLSDHCVRTWLYLKDVDVFYRGMVNSRRELFARAGLTEDTHYIASTGIEGSCDHQFDLVSMDAYSILDLAPGQISYLNDFERLCATKDYNVTFERGTRVAYADRAHHFISGTASIDRLGNTVHLGDVMRQLELALLNVDALLKSGEACLDDMMYMIVYLRDAADFSHVDAYLRHRFPDLPLAIVEGAVCRPEWLIEVEGVAIASHRAPQLPSF
jgi:enamine deaminase RidA (YjgF/YER057c/UK114 family)